jgi:hypothetical protein
MYMDSNEKDQGPDDWVVNMSKCFAFKLVGLMME